MPAWPGTRRCAASTSCSSTASDLAEGTSGRFHGLLHSGGRYAVKDPRAAEECIAENRILRRVAADCIEDTGGLFVTTPLDDPAYADRFAQGCRDDRRRLRGDQRRAGAARGAAAEPADLARVPGARRATSTSGRPSGRWATAPQQRGARVLPYHEVVAIRRDGDAVTGARVRDARTGEDVEIEARVTVNATGAWAAPDRRAGRDRGRPRAARPGNHDRDEPPAREHGHQPLPDADRRRHHRPDPDRLGDRHDRPPHRRSRRPHRPAGRGRPDARRGREARAGLPPGAGAAGLDRRAAAVRGRQGVRYGDARRDPRARAARPRAARRRRRGS